MLSQNRSRFLNYVVGYFPDHFHVGVTFAENDEGLLIIRIATPKGILASYETTAVQALDVIAMGEIANVLKARVGHI